MLEQVRTSAMQERDGTLPEFNNDRIQLRAVTGHTLIRLQCRPDAGVQIATFRERTGIHLAIGPGETTGCSPAVFWLAPNEWLVKANAIDVPALQQHFAECVAHVTHAITTMSDSLAVIELDGQYSRELLAEGCGVDLDATQFQPGRYITTRLDQITVIIHRVNEANCFHIYVDRSLARHLWQWLEDGAK